MMIDDDEGSTSNESILTDSLDDECPPPKKSRYLWDYIKGHYRLKQTAGMSCSPDCSPDSSPKYPDELDKQIRRFRARHLAKAVVDNTINEVIEVVNHRPRLDDENDIFNNPSLSSMPGVGHVEDEAVLMAIQHHGLQKPCTCSHIKRENILSKQPFHHRPTPKTPLTDFNEETDFISQAVDAAIQKKGLGNLFQNEHG
uniref:Uncharacterized protein n=1 Tax=Clastoptera arizonana TaxID=38151 RepID=A0A1B6EAL4_9HEMI